MLITVIARGTDITVSITDSTAVSITDSTAVSITHSTAVSITDSTAVSIAVSTGVFVSRVRNVVEQWGECVGVCGGDKFFKQLSEEGHVV